MKLIKSLLIAVCLVFAFSSLSWSLDTFSGKLVSVGIIEAKSSSDEGEDLTAGKSIDNNFYSRWSSAHSEEPQWLLLDMGKAETISAVAIAWELAAARIYKIQTSLDGSNWKDIAQVNDGDVGIEVINFSPNEARYVRIYCIERITQYGYSIHEIRIYKKGKLI